MSVPGSRLQLVPSALLTIAGRRISEPDIRRRFCPIHHHPRSPHTLRPVLTECQSTVDPAAPPGSALHGDRFCSEHPARYSVPGEDQVCRSPLPLSGAESSAVSGGGSSHSQSLLHRPLHSPGMRKGTGLLFRL